MRTIVGAAIGRRVHHPAPFKVADDEVVGTISFENGKESEVRI